MPSFARAARTLMVIHHAAVAPAGLLDSARSDDAPPDASLTPLQRTLQSDAAHTAVCVIISLSVIATGADTYDLSSNWQAVVDGVEIGVFVCFALEFLLRLAAAWPRPWEFFTNRRERALNAVDVVVLCVSVPGIPGGELRVLRLLRLAKLANRSKRLRLMLSALVDSMRSIASIVLLLFIVYYAYAVAGTIAFADNDPRHFGSVPDAMLTLFRSSTLEDWSDVFYVNVYGCDLDDYAWVPSPDDCAAPEASFFFAPVYFLTFVIIAGMILLSLFIGVVTLSMTNTIRRREEKRRAAARRASLLPSVAAAANQSRRVAPHLEHIGRSLRRLAPSQRSKDRYAVASSAARALRDSRGFQRTITGVILASAVIVGVRVDIDADDSQLGWRVVDWAIIGVFSAEVLVKLIAEGERPWVYFRDAWNRFDFFVALLSVLPDFGGGNILFTVRLLRLLRILRLVKAVRRLQVIVLALFKGLQSIGILSVLVTLFFYAAALLAMELFGDNDPFHWGSLHESMITLFRCATLEDWTDVMYTAMYGCDAYPSAPGVDDDEWACVDPHAFGFGAAAYFVVFIVVGALILLSLFVGVVTAAMEDATNELSREDQAGSASSSSSSLSSAADAPDEAAAAAASTPHSVEVRGGSRPVAAAVLGVKGEDLGDSVVSLVDSSVGRE